ncbi:MAG: FecR domain-containing protein [Tannerellaceae bacterium]|jgi:ferric-dicitrate binding protein FerR (iron transport regulator)|nr:FecR domain-containing protein [Tannerellaceae bacterium]
MDNRTEDKDGLIIRYLDGRASTREEARLLQWIKQSEENRNDFIRMRDLWLLCCDSASTDEAGARFRSRIQGGYALPQPHRYRLNGWWRVAAVILVCLVAGYGLGRISPGNEKMHVQNRFITAPGSKGQFVLPDGTKVWLNSNSTLSFPESFAADARVVSLEGEGYFEVAKREEQAFWVQTGGMKVEALGTAFDIACYSSDNLIEAVLLEGSVRISGESLGEPIILKPNQLLSFNKEKNTTSLSTTKAGLYIDWIKDKLVFNNDCLADIRISMEGWYNIIIDCPEEFAAHTHMSFTVRNESIEEILRAMSLIIPIRYSIEGQHVQIIPRE